MRLSLRRAVPLAVAAVAAVVLSACGDNTSRSTSGMDHGSTGMTGMTSTASPTSTGSSSDSARAGDVMFAQMMIPHHEQAVEMADIAMAKSSASAQVVELAKGIKAAQDPEIQTMTQWLKSWGGSAPTTGTGHDGMAGMSGQGMMSQGDMDTLRKGEGAAFDKQWMTMMIDLHEGAVTMAKQVLATTQDEQVKSLANAVVAAQTKEIQSMKAGL